MTSFVLVHGAWNGPWCWTFVSTLLVRAGNEVVTPTLTGAESSIDPARARTTRLHTHVDDVRKAIEENALEDIVLVGHSYGGFVVRQVADSIPNRIAEIVLLDAWVGHHGESMDTRSPAWFRDWVDASTTDDLIDVPHPSALGVSEPDHITFLRDRMTPQPRLTFSDPTRLTGAVDDIPCRAIVCTPESNIPFRQWANEFDWPTMSITAAHSAMVTHPADLARLLIHRTW